jgi:hypothetical protein
MNQSPTPSVIAQLLPILIITLPFVFLISRIAIRKGRSSRLGAWGVLPPINLFVAIWVASLPDAELTRRIEELSKKTGGNP